MNLNNKRFFKWDVARNYPVPFDGTTEKRRNVEINGSKRAVTIIPGLVSAAVALAEEELGLATKSHLHLQIGTAPTGSGGEEIFVEYSDDKNGENIVQVVAYNPETGQMRGCIYDTGLSLVKAFKFEGTARDVITDGTAIWVALLVAYKDRSGFEEIGEAYEVVKRTVNKDIAPEPQGIEDGITKLSWFFYERLSLQKMASLAMEVNVKDDDNQLKVIKKMELESGSIGPAMGKKMFTGEYKVFSDVKKTKKVDPQKVNLDKYKDYPWVKPLSEFSLTERQLVPSENPSYTPSEEFIRVMDYFYDSRNDGKDQIKQILLVGGPGGGKSTLGVMVGHYLGGGRPTLTFTCGSNYTSDELKGMLLPVPKGEIDGLTEREAKLLKAIQESSTEDMLDNCAKALDYPSANDCMFDPDEAYKQMSGREMPKGTSESDVFRVLTGLILEEQKNLSKKVEQMGAKDIEYKYMPSGIVEAMTKGYILVLDELTNMRDPAALSDLHEAFDVASPTRRIGTSTGDLFVHPDFRCITTANIGLEGNKKMNQATLNRLGQVVIPIKEPPKDQMMIRAGKRTGITDDKLLSNCYDVYNALKEGGEELHTPGVLSPRDLFVYVHAIERGTDIAAATKEILLYKLTQGGSKEDEEELMEMIEDLELLENVEL